MCVCIAARDTVRLKSNGIAAGLIVVVIKAFCRTCRDLVSSAAANMLIHVYNLSAHKWQNDILAADDNCCNCHCNYNKSNSYTSHKLS